MLDEDKNFGGSLILNFKKIMTSHENDPYDIVQVRSLT